MKTKILVLALLAVMAGVVCLLARAEKYDFVDDRLKGELGREITIIGHVYQTKTFNVIEDPKTSASYCVLIGELKENEKKLFQTIYQNDKIYSVTGKVIKVINRYSPCSVSTPASVCGSHLSYCLKARKIRLTSSL